MFDTGRNLDWDLSSIENEEGDEDGSERNHDSDTGMMRSLALLVLAFVTAADAVKCGQVLKNQMPPAQASVVANQTSQAMIGGSYAYDGSWPFVVAIYYKDWFGYHYYEGAGTIINERYVVTTYSALDHSVKASNFYVRVGSTDHTNGGTVIQVEDITYVQGENDKDHYNDIALIHLGSPIAYNNLAQPICLPTSDSGVANPGQHAWFVAWGHTSSSSFATDEKDLVQAQIPFIDNGVCRNMFDNFQPSVEYCAGGSGVTTCKDDMGGPLMQKKGDSWYLYGLSSTKSYSGCESATIFTRATPFCWFYSQVAGVECIN